MFHMLILSCFTPLLTQDYKSRNLADGKTLIERSPQPGYVIDAGLSGLNHITGENTLLSTETPADPFV